MSILDFEYVKDAIGPISREFYKWMSNIVKLNMTRVMRICTLCLNGVIVDTYFPHSINSLRANLLTTERDIAEYKDDFRTLEHIFSLIIFISLKFSRRKGYSERKTDILIENSSIYNIDLIRNFFLIQNSPLNSKLIENNEIISQLILENCFLPDIRYDPLFEKIKESKPIKHLFRIADSNRERSSYSLNAEFLKSNLPNLEDPFCMPYGLDPRLFISIFALVCHKIPGMLFFGSEKLIDDVLKIFSDYYCERLPAECDSIENTLLCFGVLLKEAKASGHIEILRSQLLNKLSEVVGKDTAKDFLETYCAAPKYESFPENWERINFQNFLSEFEDFLKYPCFCHFGKVHLGVFTVWRGLLKYFEILMKNRDFLSLKGSLIENYCFEELVKLGFGPEKIILRNKNKDPSDKYYQMKEQTESFPTTPIEIEIPFEGMEDHFTFFEIDLTVRVQDYLFVIECKGTSVAKGEIIKIFKWLYYLRKDYNLLRSKCNFLEQMIKKGVISNPFLKGVQYIIPCLLKTEGILTTYTLFLENFTYYFSQLKEHSENDKLDEFIDSFLIRMPRTEQYKI